MDRVEGDLKEGLLTDPDDAEELRTKILRLLDPVRWHRLSQKARQQAEKYAWSNYLDQIEKLLGERCSQFAQLSVPAKANLATVSS